MGTEVEPAAQAGELAPISAEEAALGAAVKGQIDSQKLKLPALKVCNGLSKVAGEVPLGHLYNGLTSEDLGDTVPVLVCATYYGRFYSIKGGGKSWSTREDVAPANWPDEYAGQRFTELDDAEEQWKAAVNAGEHPWGSGPPIQTTINFVVLLADDPDGMPFRLSMKSSDTPTAEKLQQMLATGRMPWDFVYDVSVDARPTPEGNSKYYGFEVSRGDKVTDEQRQAAIKVASAWLNASPEDIEEVGEGEDATPEGKGRQKARAGKSEGIGV